MDALLSAAREHELNIRQKVAFQKLLDTQAGMQATPTVRQAIGNYAVRMEPAVPALKSDPFALDLNDDTPLPVICELSEDGACEACQ